MGATRGSKAKAKPVTGARVPRWNVTTRTLFFEELGQTANVRQSAKAAGMSESGAHRKRRSDAAFAQTWKSAMAECYARVERLMLQRALTEMSAPPAPGDRKVAAMSDRMILALYKQHLQALREAVERGTDARGQDPHGAARARLEAKLDDMRQRLGTPA